MLSIRTLVLLFRCLFGIIDYDLRNCRAILVLPLSLCVRSPVIQIKFQIMFPILLMFIIKNL